MMLSSVSRLNDTSFEHLSVQHSEVDAYSPPPEALGLRKIGDIVCGVGQSATACFWIMLGSHSLFRNSKCAGGKGYGFSRIFGGAFFRGRQKPPENIIFRVSLSFPRVRHFFWL